MSDEKMTVEQAFDLLDTRHRFNHPNIHVDALNLIREHIQTLTAALAQHKLAIEGRDAEIVMYKALVEKLQGEKASAESRTGDGNG